MRINLKYPNTGYERTESFPFSCSDWTVHQKHDLAVCALPPDLDPSLFNITLIDMNLLMTRHEFDQDQVGEGDDLVYIGRFMGHAGKYYNLPSVRFGNISMVPNEEEPINYETKKQKRSQVGFLVEARSRSGYSGSPVFFLHRHALNNSRLVIADFDLRLLGVDWGHVPERVPLKDPFDHLHGSHWFVEVHSGMMGVVPAWYLDEFLRTSPRLIQQRKRDDEHYIKAANGGVPEDK